ncbi:hypothetical protein CsSME_00000137 [Camellia sinensis var. sinensis]
MIIGGWTVHTRLDLSLSLSIKNINIRGHITVNLYYLCIDFQRALGEALDHIINFAANSNYMSAGQINVPVVFRGPNGVVVGVGAKHSQVFIRFKHGMVPALVEREGKDVMITTFSRMVGYAIKNLTLLVPWEDSAFAHEVAEILAKEGISDEVINLCSIRPLDRATINASVWKTCRLVTIEEGFPQHVVCTEIWCSGKAFTAKGIQVLELVGKETMDLLITETDIEVDKKEARAQDDEDQLKGKKIETGAEGSANEMKNLDDSSVKKAAEMAASLLWPNFYYILRIYLVIEEREKYYNEMLKKREKCKRCYNEML